MALVLVLWVMMVLSTVALQMHFAAHLRLNVAAGTGESTKAAYLARAGVELAVAELLNAENGIVSIEDLSDSPERSLRNVELGEGTFTLYAGTDEQGELRCGMLDECAKLNINTADEETLARLSGMEGDLAKAIVQMRPEKGYWDVDDLTALEQVDLVTFYGEDQNRNGLLDANENDGEESWPPDNADDKLDEGLVAFLTARSATKNVAADGSERAVLSEASVDDLMNKVSGLSQQEADSIVAHRNGGEFKSIADLLDVDQVERVKQGEQGEQGDQNQQGQQQEQQQQNQNAQQQQQQDQSKQKDAKEDKNGENGKNEKNDAKQQEGDQKPDAEKESNQSKDNGNQEQVQYKSTGKKAFDVDRVKQIADFLAVSDDEVVKGLVNINTAPYEVLVALPGMDESRASALLQERAVRDDPFNSVVDLLDVDGITEDVFKKLCPHVTARSDVFAVRSFGVLNSAPMCRGVYAVIDRTEDEVRIARWRDLE